MQRLEWLDFARGTSILLVVMFHASIALEQHGPVSELYWLLNNFFGPIRMPVFFLISGFLARGVVQRSWHDVMGRRVAPLAYVFAVWTVIHFCFEALVPPGHDARLVSLLTSFHDPSSVLWFIWALTFYLIVAKAGTSTSPRLVMVASVLCSVAVQSDYVEFESYVYANVLRFMPFFLFGAWFSSTMVRSEVLRNGPYVVLSSLVYVGTFVVTYKQWTPPSLSGPMGFLLAMLGVNLGASVSVVACRSATVALMPLYLGRNTLAIYVAHYPIVTGLTLAFSLTGVTFWLERFWAVPVVSIIATALSLLLKAVADRFGGGWLYALPGPTRQPPRVTADQNA